eukprot:1267068-Alexandrium_andersonii.AAC.1
MCIRDSFYEMLNIDDHTGFQVCGGRGTDDLFGPPSRRDEEVFSKCDRAYGAVGLVQHPGKRTRRATHKIVIGAEVEGHLGV